ncbi:hypothetical protein H7U22_20930 [Pedobacter sp. CCM 8938]|uniref:Tetratricopeptide repeat-containing protein n=2 Tax=Pedobacter fastidiosus TaxID=2765361 RepID=A0ABR7KXQ0_9SPHI|nr:hypothetical protein [Pedobacter fastidiosus]
MEVIDTTLLKHKLIEVENDYKSNPNEINKTRLGLIYHETALNLFFSSKTKYQGYAQKAYDVLSEMFNDPKTDQALMPFIASYRASSLSLVGAETKKLKYLGEAFVLFGDAVEKYSAVSPLPEFLRGSVAENLPWFFFTKRKFAKQDFQSIIDKQERLDDYANWKIMSFTYWAWAKQHQVKKFRSKALQYLEKAIKLDPTYQAGRAKAEELKVALM